MTRSFIFIFLYQFENSYKIITMKKGLESNCSLISGMTHSWKSLSHLNMN
jgi:hypothetical protein